MFSWEWPKMTDGKLLTLFLGTGAKKDESHFGISLQKKKSALEVVAQRQVYSEAIGACTSPWCLICQTQLFISQSKTNARTDA